MPINEENEELQSLQAIYVSEVHIESPSRIVVRCPKKAQITFSLSNDYPLKSPPNYEISAPSLTTREKEQIECILVEVFREHQGDPVLYFAIEAVFRYLTEEAHEAHEQPSPSHPEDVSCSAVGNTLEKNDIDIPHIYSGDTIKDRRSVFQAHVARIKSKEEAMAVLGKLKENNKIASATHNIYAWMTTTNKSGKSFGIHDCEDDGEHGAGAKLLNLLSLMQVRDIIVVVTRWYGGIHLGPDRFRHITNVARQVMVDYGFVPNERTGK